ncbi:hypothetical protein K491DRAFT_308034 [Lophiostoma macrostomum CBS 122681]|uniref:Uncharacterized protein n=1 Tax=Lophiostoma macrostomum CBS 122681 TaxID=1314788 RepID=A0A6A6TDL0_9PLEO|nr:hypothetical protein K491DRAFT_308034 [Lophiostoma macrostomum CBS 122681]
MTGKSSVTERLVGKQYGQYLWDIMKLIKIMMQNQEYVEAHLQGRRALRGFKRLGKAGLPGYVDCIDILIAICRQEGKVDEAEGYIILRESQSAPTDETPRDDDMVSNPPVSSDDLSTSLEAAYPKARNLSERKPFAAIDFLQRRIPLMQAFEGEQPSTQAVVQIVERTRGLLLLQGKVLVTFSRPSSGMYQN